MKNDPIANWMLAVYYKRGTHGVTADEGKVLGFMRRAAELGDNDAQYALAIAYYEGQLGLEMNKQAAMVYLEQSAKGGQARARHYLGNLCSVMSFNRVTRDSVMHLRIAAAAGYSLALEDLLDYFEEGYIRHQDLAPSVRARDKNLLEVKSESRDRFVYYQCRHVEATGRTVDLTKPI